MLYCIHIKRYKLGVKSIVKLIFCFGFFCFLLLYETASTTQSHLPGVYMPERPWYLGPAPTSNIKPSSSINNNYIVSDSIVIRPASGQKTTTKKPKDEFFSWFFQSKPKKTKYEFGKYFSSLSHTRDL